MIPLIIQDQFFTIQNLQRSPILQTSNLSGTFFTVSYSKPALLFRYFKLFRLLKKLITSSWDQPTRQRIPNLRLFIMISYSTGKLKKKPVLVQYLEFCFLFQLLKLRKIPIKNWGKQDSFSLFGCLIP